jgi:hypothetical protein
MTDRFMGYAVAYRRLLLIVALTISALIAAAALFRPTVISPIQPSDVRYDGGFAYVVSIPPTRTWLYRLKTDRAENTGASRLQVREDGRTLWPAHSSPTNVRALGKGHYKHWGSQLWFSSSDGTDPRTNGRTYQFYSRLSLKPLWTALGIVSFVAAGALFVTLSWQKLRLHVARLGSVAAASGSTVTALSVRVCAAVSAFVAALWRRYVLLILRVPILLTRLVGYLFLVGSLTFVIASILALFAQWALPTAAPIQSFPLLRWAAETEPLFYVVLFTLAMSGAAASWASTLLRGTSALRRDEMLLGRFLERWGPFLATTLFVFSVSAIWAGLVREGDLNWASIAGLLPYSDASGHFVAAHDQAKDGTWSAFALRRPIGAAFRSSLLFFSGYVHMTAVLLQATLLAFAAYLATRVIGRWRGIYAGLAFFAFSYVTIRNYLPTFLSEPLGIFWALLAIPFLIAALQSHLLQSGLIGLAMTAIALFIRPGGMFVIAALGLWLVASFGNGLKQKTRTAVYAAAVVISVVGMSSLLNRLYGVGSELTGSNFSYTLCGLSIGTDYAGCTNRYEEVKTLRSEKLLTDFMYQKALENIAAQPEVIIKRLYESAVAFTAELPAVLWRGYSWWGNDYPALRLAFFALAVAGLSYVVTRRREPGEVVFWLLIWASLIASAAVVHFDDGRRVMSASYPLLWMFVAGGFLTPAVRTYRPVNAKRLARVGWIVLLASALLFFVVPWLAHRVSPVPDLRSSFQATTRPNEHIVFMDGRVTGILVLPDGAELRTDFPTLSSSHFAQFIKASNVEIYQGLLNPVTPAAPFGFIWAPRLESAATSDFQYIVPAEVIQRSDVTVWRFQVREWNRKQPYGPYWFFVENAEALR